jgi:hypothetical protein
VKEPLGQVDFKAGGKAIEKMVRGLRAKYSQLVPGGAGEEGKQADRTGADDEMSIG